MSTKRKSSSRASASAPRKQNKMIVEDNQLKSQPKSIPERIESDPIVQNLCNEMESSGLPGILKNLRNVTTESAPLPVTDLSKNTPLPQQMNCHPTPLPPLPQLSPLSPLSPLTSVPPIHTIAPSTLPTDTYTIQQTSDIKTTFSQQQTTVGSLSCPSVTYLPPQVSLQQSNEKTENNPYNQVFRAQQPTSSNVQPNMYYDPLDSNNKYSEYKHVDRDLMDMNQKLRWNAYYKIKSLSVEEMMSFGPELFETITKICLAMMHKLTEPPIHHDFVEEKNNQPPVRGGPPRNNKPPPRHYETSSHKSRHFSTGEGEGGTTSYPPRYAKKRFCFLKVEDSRFGTKTCPGDVCRKGYLHPRTSQEMMEAATRYDEVRASEYGNRYSDAEYARLDSSSDDFPCDDQY